MLHKDRFLDTIHYEKTDRPASWLGLPVPGAEPALKKYFNVSSVLELKQILDDDIFPIIDDLVILGADIIHPIQTLAKDLDVLNLKFHFAGHVALCGEIDSMFRRIKI